jgi:hypothetical protein
MTKEIPLTKGRVALIDDEDYERVSQYKWSFDNNGYAVRKSGGSKNPKKVMLHRFILDAPTGFDVDHANHDSLDNTRVNLRICNRSQNNANRISLPGSSSQYKGVSWNTERQYWKVFHAAYGVRRSLGSFHDEVEAAIAYDDAAYAAFGNFARLNFPERFR